MYRQEEEVDTGLTEILKCETETLVIIDYSGELRGRVGRGGGSSDKIETIKELKISV